MRKINILMYIIALISFVGCTEDDFDTAFLEDVDAPSNLSALLTVTQDNTGLVSIKPDGEGVTLYTVDFGDSSDTADVTPGNKAQHNYSEGSYAVTVMATGVTGLTTVLTKDVDVTFVAPEDLVVDVAEVTGDPFSFTVSATATYETYFDVTFGEDDTLEAVQFNEGDVVPYTYANTGVYIVTVTAYSGGTATTVYTEEVEVYNPLILPITFESATLNYTFTDFGNAYGAVVANPSIGGANTSATVGQFTKIVGAETWAGTYLQLDEPVDFTSSTFLSVKSYSPIAGATVLLKLENANDGAVFIESTTTTTVTNEWETLYFDFTGVDPTVDYHKVVIFYDFGNVGDGSVYYFDQVELSTGNPSLELPVTFENSLISYTFTNFGNATSQLVANPASDAVNSSPTVAEFYKPDYAETWAGSYLELDNYIDFSSQTKIAIKSWSPTVGTTVLMKLENVDASVVAEVSATTTVANGWEELVFDFSSANLSAQYVRVVVFYDFGFNGTEGYYYFDDIKLTN
ncbi:hypothetical protein NBRC110019_18330 [Neptunitalea chrysea]|uniref:PKD domain-containing protein n=1 Tax=Neptunitalea chrysea TaxID=1647581 RepID=A0A9W6EWD7_9FLAO|nr:hypothetical protein [Neptunitalea chrysea]GLB52793.1 hypothetical protein NBRC110019_18330 [Neptunitalea chrysea]